MSSLNCTSWIWLLFGWCIYFRGCYIIFLTEITTFFSKGHAKDQIHKVICEPGKEELRLLLEYVREWNIKQKFSHVSQFVLFQLFNVLPPTEIIEVLFVPSHVILLCSYWCFWIYIGIFKHSGMSYMAQIENICGF